MDFELKGRTALVTGASAGIGRGIAKVLGAEGAQVAVVPRRANLLRDLAQEMVESGAPRPLVLPLDLSDSMTPERAKIAVLDAFGHLDILVNNAGGSRPVAVDTPEEEWTQAFALSFAAARRLAQVFLPSMQRRKWGRIINVSSAFEPTDPNADQIAKAALQVWAKGFSRQIAHFGITINSISPGRIISEQVLQRLHPTAEDREQFAATNVPLGYLGEPEDVANVVAFLASPKARYITGAIIHVDGGLHRFAF